MKVTTKLNVSAAEVFNRLMDVALFDIQKETGQIITLEQLEGLNYQAYVAQENLADIKIIEVCTNQSYAYEIKTKLARIKERYELTDLAHNQVQLSYIEEIYPNNKMLLLKQRIVELLFGWLKKHNLKKTLKYLEFN